MKNFVITILTYMLLLGITNIVIPQTKCEKQIRFLLGLLFISSVFDIISDFCNISQMNVPSVFSAENAGIYEEDAYSEINEYILSDYTFRLSEDIRNKLKEELGFLPDVSVSVNEDEESDRFGEIISVRISYMDEDDFAGAKKMINSFYDVKTEHIIMQEKGE